MKAFRAKYEDGQVKFQDKPETDESAEVLVIFPDADPWETIERDTARRPALEAAMQKALEEDEAGLARPLKF